ncbi:MAG: hypothetical protein AMXMBFR4_02200 [Candidatus Hydrogenedentota bacterium]
MYTLNQSTVGSPPHTSSGVSCTTLNSNCLNTSNPPGILEWMRAHASCVGRPRKVAPPADRWARRAVSAVPSSDCKVEYIHRSVPNPIRHVPGNRSVRNRDPP